MPSPTKPFGLPPSPRSTRPPLSLKTTFTPSSSSETLTNQQNQQQQQRTPLPHHRNTSSLIFINATIPLSPASTTSNDSATDALLDGLRPRKRNGFVRLFCCFGREERARRKVLRATQFEKVGGEGHWSEY